MPTWPNGFPPAPHVVDYLSAYEKKYTLPVQRPVRVAAVHRTSSGYRVDTDTGSWNATAVINATGTWSRPFWPSYPGMHEYRGTQLHASNYRTPAPFNGQCVGIVGGGNSAAQILAEVSTVADTVWFTTRPPKFLPDDVDGRVLFEVASERARALATGGGDTGGVAGLGDIVMVPPVKQARDRGVLHAQPMFTTLTADGVRGGDTTDKLDAIIWCTGFRPALRHLQPLHLRSDSAAGIALDHNHVHGEPSLVFLGYGDWTGPGSATIIGVGRTARDAVTDLVRDVLD